MLTDADFLWEMRMQLRTALPSRAFLRRDRGEGLFVTNAAQFGFAQTVLPGFHLKKQGPLMRITPDKSWILLLEKAHPEPPDDFTKGFIRFRGEEISHENLMIFVQGAKLLDAGSAATEAEIAAFDRILRQRAAMALRGACTGGGLYAAALMNTQIFENNNINHIKGEENP